MTRHESVRDILSSVSYPYRNSPPITVGPSPSATPVVDTHSVDLRDDSSVAGHKRSPPDTSEDWLENIPPSAKKARRNSGAINGHEEWSRGRGITLTRTPVDTPPRIRSVSPGSLSWAEAVETMLNRSEELGGNKTTKLTRGVPSTHTGSPAPSRYSPRPASRQAGSESASYANSFTRRQSASSSLLEDTGLAEFFQQDERPIFILDVHIPLSDGLPVAFTNTALRHKPGLFDSIHGRFGHEGPLLPEEQTQFSEFTSWLLSDLDMPSAIRSFAFNGYIWKISVLRRHFRVVTGSQTVASPSSQATKPYESPVNRPADLHAHRSSESQQTTRPAKPEAPGYFDVKPTTNAFNIPRTLQGFVRTGDSETDVESSFENISNGPTSASQGDSAMHDLLNPQISPRDVSGDGIHTLLPLKTDPESLNNMRIDYLSDKGFFDWTRLPMSPSLPAHIQFAKRFDWSTTSLGPIEEWPADLRGMCNLIMASPHPAAMYWGPDHVAIYNEPYTMLAGNKHPQLMGSRYSVAWAEIWDVISDVFHVAMVNAQATMRDDDCLFIRRDGFLEETYFSWSIIPLIGDDGSVVGLYNPAFEKTRRKIAERRMLTLREIGEKTSAARSIADFWPLLLQGFEYNEYDAPLVIIYSLNEAEDSDAVSSTSSTAAASKQCRLEGTLGVPDGHVCAPDLIDLKQDTRGTGFGALFKKAITSDRPIVLSVRDGTLDANIFEGIQWRGFGDPSTIVVVAPIRPTSGESTLGFLVMGTNPRRPYDEDYDLFIQLLSRQLATSIASVVLFEEEIRKGREAAQIAAQDRIELTNQLAVRTQEAVESENKFTRMAELAPVGMYIGDESGYITFANEAWYRISSFPLGREIGHEWIRNVKEEDKEKTWQVWQTLLAKKCPISVEFRFKTPRRDKFGNLSELWVLASASPEIDEDGKITRVFGSVTDISSQKFAEALQRRRMEEAVAIKQQQERYIDTTSHEMRNPLSAILQSADAITGSLIDLKNLPDFEKQHGETIDTIIESAQTITLCAQHQKRIVDDVLTLSKLDSAMLLVTPVDAQPEAIVRRTVRMFEGESQTVDIQLSVQVDKSFKQLNIEWVRVDPTRLSQVLINLMTNAIKFTTTQEKRVIKMHLAASREKPSSEATYNLTYIPSQAPKDKDITAGPAWGLGEPLYLHFAVSDTGRGLDDSEKKQLFQRFSQANPRTHVTYGGSGLGLFISRELVELQGGEIGVASEAGKGSTFAFYVKVRRSQAPVAGSDEDIMDVHHIANRKASSSSSHKSKTSKLRTAVLNSESSSDLTSPRTTTNKLLTSRHDAHGLRVLIVEDNLINQKVLAAQLKKLGCIVSVANHGGEAIEHIKKSVFYNHVDTSTPAVELDVVLMDLEMPVMDGMTCARTLRAMQRSGELVRHVPVIAVTANAREEQIKDTLDAGIDDVVSKPFRIPELVPKMRATIAKFKTNVLGNSSGSSTDSLSNTANQVGGESAII